MQLSESGDTDQEVEEQAAVTLLDKPAEKSIEAAVKAAIRAAADVAIDDTTIELMGETTILTSYNHCVVDCFLVRQ